MQEYRQENQENRLEADPSRYVLPPKFGQKRRAATLIILAIFVLIMIVPYAWSHKKSYSSLATVFVEDIQLLLVALVVLTITFVATKLVMKIYRKIKSYRPLPDEKFR